MKKNLALWVVLVAGLGYFVDIYDLLLFSIVRTPSLKSLGFQGEGLVNAGLLLLNLQMAGMLVGGFLWGVLADRIGRTRVLFGSILLYSLANAANAFVTGLAPYAALRFVAGVGLAGELGAGVALVLETLPAARRGLGAALVASIGVAGAVVANLVARWTDWRTAYLIGGGLGFALLFLRAGVLESGAYRAMKAAEGVRRGDLRLLFGSGARLARLAAVTAVALPLWTTVGLVITFTPELAKAMGVAAPVAAGDAVMVFYAGLVLGDLGCGWVSQLLKSRRRALFAFMAAYAVILAAWAWLPKSAPTGYLALLGVMGVSCGYWAVFMTVAGEQFGTNLRGTVTGLAPNLVRAWTIPATSLFLLAKPLWGSVGATAAVCALSLVLAVAATVWLPETFHADLDRYEREGS